MKKIILVTGGTRGIGSAIAMEFKKHGHMVAVTYAGNDDAAHKFEQEHDIKTFKWDVSSFNECKDGVKKVEEYMKGSVEILINNAGITRDAMLHKQTYENWENVLQTNLSSVFNMCRSTIEGMRSAKYGRIINISSVNAHGAAGQTNYAAAKAGIEGFTKSLALEIAKLGVTVNAIAPGYIDTDMVAAVPADILATIVDRIPMKRLGKKEEIAALALFLASDEAAFITGAVIPINGGLWMQ